MKAVADVLRSAGVESPEREARWIAQAATGRAFAEVVVGESVGDQALDAALDLAARRALGAPLQYVTGTAGFRRLDLVVGPGVFIPRPETEVVVERALEHLPRGGRVVDVATGSGAVALAIAHERPDATVFATDISEEALAWAEENRSRLRLDVSFLHGDLFEPLRIDLRQTFDVVVSNPPYVATGEALPAEVVEHEPPESLFAGESGMDVVERLVAEARCWVTPGGWLVAEIGAMQGPQTAELFENGGWADVMVTRDLAGRERVVEGRLRS